MDKTIESSNSSEHRLGYLGLLPFVYLALGLPTPAAIPAVAAFNLYSLGIVIFMAGALWRKNDRTNLFSNLVTLTALASALLFSPTAQVLIFAALFASVWAWERRYFATHYPDNYWKLRGQLTAVVIACHGIMFIRLWLATGGLT